MFFDEQTASSLSRAVHAFEHNQHLFSAQTCGNHAANFSPQKFRTLFTQFVNNKFAEKERLIVSQNTSCYSQPHEYS
jgi:hypothetical protein